MPTFTILDRSSVVNTDWLDSSVELRTYNYDNSSPRHNAILLEVTQPDEEDNSSTAAAMFHRKQDALDLIDALYQMIETIDWRS
jgi:hypothetical protein